ncbi:MAG: DUF1552 domain-containing protein [Deltaproteobacteria bacterium]|nr:DUF1552 domain-containing protein [Deltaproteobacteria bacterium]
MIGRRTLLRAMGLGAVAAPWIPWLPVTARADAIAKRVVFVHFAHGVARDRWSPTASEEGLVLSPLLSPLAPMADRLVVVEGLDNPSGLALTGDAHNIALGTLMTAMPLAADLGPGGHYLPGGVSIDRRLAPELASREGPTPWASLHLGVRSQGFALSAADAGHPVRAEDDPTAAFERLFGEWALPPALGSHRAAQRTRARDVVRGRLDALRQVLPGDDRQHLDDHLHAMEALQARLNASALPPEGCVVPSAPAPVPHAALPLDADVPTLVQAQTELAVRALACDLTRVVTVQWGSSGNDGLRHVWQGIDDDFHATAHLANGQDAQAHEHLAAMNTWTMEQLAELLGQLAAVPQGDGSLLDHTVVVALSSLSVGHHMGDLPVVLAGGGLTGGRTVQASGQPLAALWLALAEHLGVPLASFGDPAYDVGPLTGLS